MNERERIIHLWFDMWLKQQDLGIDSIFTEDVIYTERQCQISYEKTEPKKKAQMDLATKIKIAAKT